MKGLYSQRIGSAAVLTAGVALTGSTVAAETGSGFYRDFCLALVDTAASAHEPTNRDGGIFDLAGSGTPPVGMALPEIGSKGEPYGGFAPVANIGAGEDGYGVVRAGFTDRDAVRKVDGVPIVPLPSAATGGLTLLLGLAGVGYLRRQRQ